YAIAADVVIRLAERAPPLVVPADEIGECVVGACVPDFAHGENLRRGRSGGLRHQRSGEKRRQATEQATGNGHRGRQSGFRGEGELDGPAIRGSTETAAPIAEIVGVEYLVTRRRLLDGGIVGGEDAGSHAHQVAPGVATIETQGEV